MKIAKENIKKLKKKGYLHYFDGEMYVIVVLVYLLGFAGGWIRQPILILTLIFFSFPFWMKHYKDKEKK